MASTVPRSGALLVSSPSYSSSFIGSGSARRSIPSLARSLLRPTGRTAPGGFIGVGIGLLSIQPSYSRLTSRRRPYFSSSLAPRAAGTTDAPVEDAPSPAPPSSPGPEQIKEAADALDFRVGRILRAWRHPEADSLYVEEVDVGEAEPRTICSGLVNYIPLDHLQDIKVVVLANLKPRNMRGIKSNGMLMAASDASHETVELLTPSEGSVPGERIWFGSEEEKGMQPEAATPNQVQKKKIWESVQPHLKTTDSCVAVLSGIHPMRTSAGLVVCRSLKSANIS